MSTIRELSSLRGRHALITGATGHLGQVIAGTLAELGADLILVDKPGSDFYALTASITDRWAVKLTDRCCDLEQPEQRADLVAWLNNDWHKLNVLVNNAAFVGTSDLQGWSVPFEDQSVAVWRQALELNLTAIFDLCKGLTPLLKKAKGANIVNIASIYGMYGPDWSIYEGAQMGNPAAYSVSKGGLIQLTRWLATTLAPAIRVNAIAPGGIWRNQPESFVARYSSRTPLNRMATEDDLRGAIAFMASDMSQYVTGQTLAVDGGWGIW